MKKFKKWLKKLKILIFPDPRLRKVAVKVKNSTKVYKN